MMRKRDFSPRQLELECSHLMGKKPLRGQRGDFLKLTHILLPWFFLLLRAIRTPLSRTNSILWNCYLELGQISSRASFHLGNVHRSLSCQWMSGGWLSGFCECLGGTRMASQPIDARSVHWEVSVLGEPWGVCLNQSLNVSPLLLAQSCFNRCGGLKHFMHMCFPSKSS